MKSGRGALREWGGCYLHARGAETEEAPGFGARDGEGGEAMGGGGMDEEGGGRGSRHQLDSRMRVSRPGHGTGREGGGSVNP